MLKCESCGGEVSPDRCYIRVTGWGKASKSGTVKELFGVSAPHGYLCESCGFDAKNKRDQTQSMF